MTYWVQSDDGLWAGPESLDTLRDWIRSGRLQPYMLLREEGQVEPIAAAANPELSFPSDSFPEDPPPMALNPPVPDERLRRFNWGAFAFGWIWGLAHGKGGLVVLIPLSILLLIATTPLLALVILLMVHAWIGIYGNQWAWESGRFETLDEMMNCEDQWHRVAMWVLGAGCLVAVYMGLLLVDEARHGMNRSLYPPPRGSWIR